MLSDLSGAFSSWTRHWKCRETEKRPQYSGYVSHPDQPWKGFGVLARPFKAGN